MQTSISNIRSAISALKNAGNDDEKIVQRLLNSPGVSEEAKQIFRQAQEKGMAGKAVSDFMALPTAPLVNKKDLEINDVEIAGSKVPGKILSGVSSLIGSDKLSRWLGAKAAMLSPSHRENVRTLEERGEGDAAKTLKTAGVSNRELVASAAQTALTLASMGAGKALQGASMATKVMTGTAVGTGLGVSGSLKNDEMPTMDELAGAAAFGGVVGGAVPFVFEGAKKVLNVIGDRGPKILAILTGESDDVVRNALKNPEAARAAAETGGDDALRAIVQKGSENSIALRQEAIREQGNFIASLAKGNPQAVYDKKGMVAVFKGLLEDRGVKVGKAGLDFTGSKIVANPGEVTKIQNAWAALQAHGDNIQFSDIYKFKQLVGTLTRFADDAGVPSKSPTLGSFYKKIDDVIKVGLNADDAKIYSHVNREFSNQIELLDEIVDAFNKRDPFTTIANVFSKNKDTLRQVMDVYEARTGEKVLGTVAGRELGMEKIGGGGIPQFLRSLIDAAVSPKTQARAITSLPGKVAEGTRILDKLTPRQSIRDLGRGVKSSVIANSQKRRTLD